MRRHGPTSPRRPQHIALPALAARRSLGRCARAQSFGTGPVLTPYPFLPCLSATLSFPLAMTTCWTSRATRPSTFSTPTPVSPASCARCGRAGAAHRRRCRPARVLCRRLSSLRRRRSLACASFSPTAPSTAPRPHHAFAPRPPRLHLCPRPSPSLPQANRDIDALIQSHDVTISHVEEVQLALHIAKMPEAVEDMLKELAPNRCAGVRALGMPMWPRGGAYAAAPRHAHMPPATRTRAAPSSCASANPARHDPAALFMRCVHTG